MKSRLNQVLNNRQLKSNLFVEIAILMLVLFSFGLLLFELTHHLDPASKRLFQWLDRGVLLIFLLEYLARLWVVESDIQKVLEITPWQQFGLNLRSRLRYVLTPMGFADLLVLLPLLPYFSAFRALRLVRLFRLVRLHWRIAKFLRLLKYNSLLYLTSFSFVLGSMFLGAVGVMIFEQSVPDSPIRDFPSALWWALVTITTVGYGDIVPASPEGKIVAGLLMIAGLITVALFAGVISETLLSELMNIKGDRALVKQMNNHVVILGWNDKGSKLIEEIQAMSEGEKGVVVMADSERPASLGLDIPFLQGEPALESELDKVRLKYADSVVILSHEVGGQSASQADSHSILVTFAVRAYERKLKGLDVERQKPIHLCAELQNQDNYPHLRTAGVDEIILTNEIGTYMLAQATITKGVSTIFERLLQPEGSELYTTRISERLLTVSRDYDDLAAHLRKQHRVSLVGFVRNGDLQMNPQAVVSLAQGDTLVLMADNRKQVEALA